MVKVIHSLSTELGNPPSRYRKAGWGQHLRTENKSPEDAAEPCSPPWASPRSHQWGRDLRLGFQAHLWNKL